MEHPYLFFVKLFELIGLGDFAHHNTHVVYTWVVMIFLIVVGALAAKAISIVPGKMQNLFEIAIGQLEEFMVSITGEEGRWFFPIIGTVFIFIFICNLTGLIPGFFPPTASANTNLACALTVFFFTHFLGIKYHGAKYYKHFIGPVWWLIPIILPIELIGHLARVLSLTMRLFGNMFGHEMVLGILFGLAGAFFAPLPIMAMGIFVSFVQAFVFFMLSTMYFQASMDHAH
ncbi:MAG: F0F1 ATP synthase subunit A [Deltaproteobacteria bacterium]|nr:F0F1 ATP synthase subunit A [Deltaproteobacteria bacterium]